LFCFLGASLICCSLAWIVACMSCLAAWVLEIHCNSDYNLCEILRMAWTIWKVFIGFWKQLDVMSIL
jgi:hypothetical protein